MSVQLRGVILAIGAVRAESTDGFDPEPQYASSQFFSEPGRETGARLVDAGTAEAAG